MIVDDDLLYRRALRRILRGEGVEVVAEAGSIAEAIARARQVTTDAIIVDVHLPDGSGVDLIPRLRRLCPSVRVIAASGSDYRRVAADAGASAFLPKSSGSSQIMTTIRDALETPDTPVPNSVTGSRVLIVDDDFSVLSIAKKMLPDCEVAIASDAATAMARTYSLEPDVIVLDIHLPDCDGLDLIPTLLSISPRSRVLVMTSDRDEGLRSTAWLRGARAFAEKTDLPQIRRVVERTLALRRKGTR